MWRQSEGLWRYGVLVYKEGTRSTVPDETTDRDTSSMTVISIFEDAIAFAIFCSNLRGRGVSQKHHSGASMRVM